MEPERAQAIQDAARWKAIKEAREIEDMKLLLGLPAGKRVLGSILGTLGLWRSPFVEGKTDLTNFNCGAQFKAIEISNWIEAAKPGTLLQIQHEYRSLPENQK